MLPSKMSPEKILRVVRIWFSPQCQCTIEKSSSELTEVTIEAKNSVYHVALRGGPLPTLHPKSQHIFIRPRFSENLSESGAHGTKVARSESHTPKFFFWNLSLRKICWKLLLSFSISLTHAGSYGGAPSVMSLPFRLTYSYWSDAFEFIKIIVVWSHEIFKEIYDIFNREQANYRKEFKNSIIEMESR